MLSLANIAKQIQEDSKNKLLIDVEHVQTKQICKDLAWVFPATYGIYPVELIVFTRLKGFVYQLIVKNPKNVSLAIACTKEKDYVSETFGDKNMRGKCPHKGYKINAEVVNEEGDPLQKVDVSYKDVPSHFDPVASGKTGDDGKTTLYAHLASADVKENEVVDKGQRIGMMGSTGASTGPHLHFETRFNSIPYDPDMEIHYK